MIIGISGKKQSGKDTVGKIIQGLTISEDKFINGIHGFLASYDDYGANDYPNEWHIRKFADKLKDIVCLLLNCTRAQLEDEQFKNTPLDNDWDRYEVYNPTFDHEDYYMLYATEKEAIDCVNSFDVRQAFVKMQYRRAQMTPRLLLQLIGTDCGRNIVHPNIWINSALNSYDAVKDNWLITDTRFVNEATAIHNKHKDNILIRVNSNRCNSYDLHESETALDNYAEFDYVIDNNGTIDELIQKIKEILIKLNICQH